MHLLSCVALSGQGLLRNASTWLTPTRVRQHSSGTRSCKRSASLPHGSRSQCYNAPHCGAGLLGLVNFIGLQIGCSCRSGFPAEPGNWNATWEYSCKRKLQAGTPASFKKARALSPKYIHRGAWWTGQVCLVCKKLAEPALDSPMHGCCIFCPSTDVCMEGPETTCHTDVPIAGCHPNPTKPRIVLPFLGGRLETRRLWCVMCTNRNMSTNWPLSALMCFACWQICLLQPWPSQIFLLLPLVLWLWCSTKSPHIHIQHWDWKSKQMPFLEAHHNSTSNDSRDKMQQKAGSISLHFSATRAGSAQGLSIWLYLSSPHKTLWKKITYKHATFDMQSPTTFASMLNTLQS